MKIPYPVEILETKLEEILRRGKDKLSDLFIIFKSPEEADFVKELPDKLIKDLRMNLKTYEFRKKASLDEFFVWNFRKFESDIEDLVDTNKIRVFFMKSAPGNMILSLRKYPYPKISKIKPHKSLLS